MANELFAAHQPSKTVYAILWKVSTNYVWDVGDSALEAAGTWNAARIAECDIALTDRGGGNYTATFPAACTTEGIYRVLYYERAGGAPATTDRRIKDQHEINWNGTTEVTSPTATGSGYTLADIKSICYYHGWHDKTTDGASALTRFINQTIYKLSILAQWPEYHKRDGRITLATSDEDYVCTDDSDTTIEGLGRIGSVYSSVRSVPLDEISIEEWLFEKTHHQGTGQPNRYALRKYLSSGLIRQEMLVYPKPTSSQNGGYLYFPYQVQPVEMALSTDTTDWPNYRAWLLEDALETRIASGKRDTQGTILESRDFMMMVEKAFADSRPSYMPIQAKGLGYIEPGKWRLEHINKVFT